jgi:hypothetical protein
MPRTAMPTTGLTAHFKPLPDVMDQSTTRADLVEVLEDLKFDADDQLRTIKIDSPVRDFIVAALRRKI